MNRFDFEVITSKHHSLDVSIAIGRIEKDQLIQAIEIDPIFISSPKTAICMAVLEALLTNANGHICLSFVMKT